MLPVKNMAMWPMTAPNNLPAIGAINLAIFQLNVEYEMYTVMSARVLDT